MQYRDAGYLPHALLNYLVRLGWSHGDQEIFSIDEMQSLFDLKDVNAKASRLDSAKLGWLNQQYLKNDDPADVAKHLEWHLQQAGCDLAAGPAPRSEEHTSELQSLMRISYAVFRLTKKNHTQSLLQ